MGLRELLIPAAVLGPAAAALVWLILVRWPWPRRVAATLVWIGGQIGAWAVFWEAFGGEAPTWFGLSPDLLRSTLAAVGGLAVTLVLPRLDALPARPAAAGVAAAGVGLAAVTAAAYATSLVSLAVLLPVPTLAVALAGVVGDRARRTPGLLGLAAADGAALAGLALLLDRHGTTVLGPLEGSELALGMLLTGAALKMGAVPHLATWSAAASEGIASPLTVVLRAQGAVLAAAGGLVLGGGRPFAAIAGAAAGLALFGGVATLVGPRAPQALAGVGGAGAAAVFLALGLGGGVGARAALMLLPVVLLAAAVVATAGWPAREDPHEPRPLWRWAGALALAVGAASLVGLPPAGGFPGTSLALALAGTRAVAEPWHLVLVGATVGGLGLAALGAAPSVRVARTRPLPAAAASLAALALLYAGAQPLRLGLGWLLRVEAELHLPEVLPSAGGPALPPIGGTDLAWALLPAVAIVLGVLVLGRGVRDVATEPEPLLRLPAVTPHRWARGVSSVARRIRLGYALAALLEAAAVGAAAWIVLRGIDLGFL